MRLKLISFLLCFILLLNFCSIRQIANKNLEGKIIGRWDIQIISSSVKPDSVLLGDFNNMLQTLLINAFISFAADHKFNGEIAGKHYQGQWSTDSKYRKLILIENDKEIIYSIEVLKDDAIDLTTQESDQKFSVQLRRTYH